MHRLLLLAVLYTSISGWLDAKDFLSLNRVGSPTINAALNGRAFFEAYPSIEIPAPRHFPTDWIEEDKQYLRQLPLAISSEELLLIHRENNDKRNRIFETLGILPKRCPKSKLLMDNVLSQINDPLVYLKVSLKRPRPFDLVASYPLFMEKPTLPSYPSGDATEGYVLAYLLSEIFTNERIKQELIDLADQMARRRVLAGVSFPSDIKGAKLLAEQMAPALLENLQIKQLLSEAREEIFAEKCLTLSAETCPLTLQASDCDLESIVRFKNELLEKVIERIQVAAQKSIKLKITKKILITDSFNLKDWSAHLDLFALENGLKITETMQEILIYEPKTNHE